MARRETRQELETRLREMESELESVYDQLGEILGVEDVEPEEEEDEIENDPGD